MSQYYRERDCREADRELFDEVEEDLKDINWKESLDIIDSIDGRGDLLDYRNVIETRKEAIIQTFWKRYNDREKMAKTFINIGKFN